MLKRLLNKVKAFFAIRELNMQIAKQELSTTKYTPSIIEQEAHETYRLGDFTATVMGSDEELKRRVFLTRLERTTKKLAKKNALDQLAFDNLIQVDDE